MDRECPGGEKDQSVKQNPTEECAGRNLDESVVDSGSYKCTEEILYQSVMESGGQEWSEGNLEESVVKNDSEECAGGSMDQPVMENSRKKVTIGDLPNDILMKIFSYIKNDDLALNVRHVSQRWKGVVDETKSLWTDYTLEVGNGLEVEDAISLMKNMPLLKRFNSRLFEGHGDEIVNTLAFYCRVLTVMIIPHLWISGDCMELIIESFPCLSELRIALNSQMERQIKAVSRSSNLINLQLLQHPEAVGKVAPGLLVPLAEGCPKLSILHFNYVKHQIEDMNHLLIKKKDKLESLYWKGSMHSTTFVCLNEFTVLKQIIISDLHLTDIPPTSHNIPDINLASIENISYSRSNIQFLTSLIYESLPSLISLKINDCSGQITTALSRIFPRCQNLRSLILEDIMFDKNVFTLMRSKLLNKVCLDCCFDWGPFALKHLTKHCIKLTELSLCELNMTPNIANAIFNMYHLQKIQFYNCNLVNMNFKLLCQNFLPKLNLIVIKNCVMHSKFYSRNNIFHLRPEITINIS